MAGEIQQLFYQLALLSDLLCKVYVKDLPPNVSGQH